MSTLVLPILQGTLPGFPYAPQPSALESFLVIVGIPVALAAVIALFSGGMARHQAQVHARDAASTSEIERRELAAH